MKRRADLLAMALAAALGACEPLAPAEAPVVHQHVYSTTNVYITQVAAPASASVSASTSTLAPEPPPDPCEAYVAKAEACVRSITSDEAARARAAEALEDVRRAASAGDPAARAAAQRACSRGLLGYAYAPCD